MNPVAIEKPKARPITRSLFVDSTPLLADPGGLRERVGRDGYLFFKGLLPRDYVMSLRADILAVADRHRWRMPGQDRWGGLINRDVTDTLPDAEVSAWGTGEQCYRDVQHLESFHRFPHHRALLALYRTLFQEDVLVHARTVARMLIPHRSNFPTPPHQDFPFVQGATSTMTCWIPLGDCPRTLGGLTVLRGSHHAGQLPVRPAKGAGGHVVELCPWETEWVEGDYDAGDVLTFNSLVVHKSLRSEMKDRLRLSLDVRFQALSEPVEVGSLRPHLPDLEWEDIYRDWKSDDLKYYWQKLALRTSPWDPTRFEAKARAC
ncbi:phytanoyl-CoA dioxygenase family protein [Horticoccus luteus]|uniref:Phytanoyl-CoA dioxygenase family protein n=1 Tax=Horticoccus luteus TaxID=2862869 RepID=A0A8F9XKW5_9BACT|nr:phytanoyl-CoA dioxygenase family protein [Horticoccus luteus]QYM78459.1 phytanoyl-CoA dioxygenase family protein [Horticoccus luteus]